MALAILSNNNPEIIMEVTVPIILSALTDPTLRSPEALIAIAIEKSFENTPWL